MSSKESLGLKDVKGVSDDRARGLAREPLSPECAAKVNSELVDSLLCPIRAKSGTSDMLIGVEQEDRPVLKTLLLHLGNLFLETQAHHFRRKRSTDFTRHFGVAPQLHG